MLTDNARTSVLSLADLSQQQVRTLVETAHSFSTSPAEFAERFRGVRVGLIFTAPSTRTRASFWNAAETLGCRTLHLGASELQVSTGESWRDTGAVLANYLDAAVVRTNGPQEHLRELTRELPAVNALTYEEHPTQAIADWCALRDHFGEFDGLRLAYLGLVNNTARSLAQLVVKIPGMSLDVYSPEGAGFPDDEIKTMNADARREAVRQQHDIPATPSPVDALYTTRWQSMGVAHEDPGWYERFDPFKVTTRTVERFSAGTRAVFMHDLPAIREQEVTSEVLDAPWSLVPGQAFHKTSAAVAALVWVLGARGIRV